MPRVSSRDNDSAMSEAFIKRSVSKAEAGLKKLKKSLQKKKKTEKPRPRRSVAEPGSSSVRAKADKDIPIGFLPEPCEISWMKRDGIQTTTALPRSDENPLLDFPFRSGEDEFIHPLMILRFQFQILRENGDKLEEKFITLADGKAGVEMDKVVPINFFQNTLWSQVSVTFNDTVVTPQENTHPFLAYKRLLEDYSDAVRTNLMEVALYAKDDNPSSNANDPTKVGAAENFKWRAARVKQSNLCEVSGPLLINGFDNENFWIPPGVSVKVSLQRAPTSFALMSPESNTTKYKISIAEAELQIMRMKLSPDAFVKYYRSMNSLGYTAMPLRLNETRVLNVASGSNKLNHVCWDGRLPATATVLMINTAAFNGSYPRNPLAFELFGLKSIAFEVNGRQITEKPVKVDTDKSKYTQLYMNSLLARCDPNGMLHDLNLPYGYEDFAQGYGIMTFRIALTPPGCYAPPENGILRLMIEFASPTTQELTVLVIGENDRAALVCKDRSVHVIPLDEESFAYFKDRQKKKFQAATA